MAFCGPRGISFSPATCDQTYFYGGGAEIDLEGKGHLPLKRRDGSPDFENASPPSVFRALTMKVRHGATFEEAAETARQMFAALPVASVNRSVELDAFLVDLPLTLEIEKGDDLLPTDMVEGWRFQDGGYEANVESGEARIHSEGGLWRLSVDGVARVSTRELNDAFAYAGRCDWRWWYGPKPASMNKAGALPSP